MHFESAINLVALVMVLLLDQASKSVVQSRLGMSCSSLGSWVDVRPVIHHKRIYRARGGRALLTAVWLLALILLFVLPGWGGWMAGRHSLLGLAIALGAAAGNLADILRLGYVLDFVDLGWWPVFNLADIGIVTGLLLAFWA
jgi:signal peptidase II